MLEFLKRLFPKKGENIDDLDDMYRDDEYEDTAGDRYNDEMPKLEKESSPSRFEGILPDLFRKFRRKSADRSEDYADEPIEDTEDAEEEASAEQPGLLSRINDLEGAPKFAFLGVVTVLLVGVTYTGIKFFRGDFDKPSRPQNPPISVENLAEDSGYADRNAQPVQRTPDNPMQVAALPNAAGGMENPFVEANKMLSATPGSVNGTTPVIPGEVRSIPVSAKAMPAIPSVPRPEISAPPPASIPLPNDMNAQGGGSPASVQGVITGSNPEDNVAIMGDGTVVSVGETYHDGRIAYIGGDGITFDNGKQIKMKQ